MFELCVNEKLNACTEKSYMCLLGHTLTQITIRICVYLCDSTLQHSYVTYQTLDLLVKSNQWCSKMGDSSQSRLRLQTNILTPIPTPTPVVVML